MEDGDCEDGELVWNEGENVGLVGEEDAVQDGDEEQAEDEVVEQDGDEEQAEDEDAGQDGGEEPVLVEVQAEERVLTEVEGEDEIEVELVEDARQEDG